MRDRIEINKELIPYSFDILLAAEWYTFEIHYNEIADQFTVTLSKDDEVLVFGEPIVYGVPLFTDLYQSGIYPPLEITPLDESGQETEVNWNNLNETVFLTIEGGD